jgi:hypothetical protein
MTSRYWLAGGSSVLLISCSWARFGDLEDNSPVVVLDRSAEVVVGGRSLALCADGGKTDLVVAGTGAKGGAARYDVSSASGASTSPTDEQICPSDSCALAQSVAGIDSSTDIEGAVHGRCVVPGWTVGDAAGAGLLLSCGDRWETTLRTPAGAASEAAASAASGTEVALVLASDHSRVVLAAASTEAQSAWVYADTSTAPLELPSPVVGVEGFGSAVAVVSAAGGPLVAVGAAAAKTVILYRLVPAGPEQVGCLSQVLGTQGSMTAGDVDGDGQEDLALTTNTGQVRLLSGAALLALTTSDTDCSADWAPDAEMASFSCAPSHGLTRCEGADFGASLAIADLQGDGSAEVVVGVPGARAGGASSAGGALVFHPSSGAAPLEAHWVSSAESGARFGTSLAAIPVAGRDVLALGGLGSVAVSYCSSLVLSSERTKRCR